MKSPTYAVTLAESANLDFIEIMNWTVERFGSAAAGRYEALIGQALIDLGVDPLRPSVKQRPELSKAVYTYHLANSRERVPGERVKDPRHFILYRVVSTRVEVLRILHDSRDLAQHLPVA